MQFEGRYNIYEMDMWSEEYFNMECQAYLFIQSDFKGNFQFGLVSGDIRGKVKISSEIEVFEFRFSGVDEMDSISGEGWITFIDDNTIKGEFSFDDGDSSGFFAKKVEK